MKFFLVIVGFLVWSIGSSWYYVCKIKYLCDQPVANHVTKYPPQDISVSIDSVVNKFDKSITIEFENGQSMFASDSTFETYLTQLAAYLHKNPKLKVKIIGNTDSIGSEVKNYDLGLLRANFVKNQLINLSTNKDQILATSHGETHPIARNSTPIGRRHNRRVDFEIITP